MFRYNGDFTTEFHHLSEAISLIAEDESFDEHTRKCADVIVQNIDEGSLNSTFEDALKNADLVDIEEFIEQIQLISLVSTTKFCHHTRK